MLVALAWRNLWRHRRRTLLTAAAMGVSVAFVMALLAFTDGMYRQMGRVMVDETLGQVQVHHPDYTKTREMAATIPAAGDRLAAVAALPDVRVVVPRLYGYALLGGAQDSSGAQLVGVDPTREPQLAGLDRNVRDGRWLAADGTHEIVLGAGLAKSLAAPVGSEVVAVTQAADGSLGNELYTVVGIATSGSAALDRAGAWLSLTDVQDLLVLPDQAHELLVLSPSLDPEVADPAILATAESVRRTVGELRPGETSAPPIEVKPWWEISPMTAQMLSMSDFSAWITLGIVFGAAGLGILNTMLMSVFERTRELGVMMALGTRPRRVVALVVWESALLASLATGTGLALGLAFDTYLVRVGVPMTTGNGERFSTAGVLFDTHIRGVIDPARVAETVIGAVLVAILAALWPAMRAARLRPVDAMRGD